MNIITKKHFNQIHTYIKTFILISLFVWSGSYSFASDTYKVENYDVIVYGATSAGITASIAAAQEGQTVLLISQDNFIGGMTASGLGATDINEYQAIGGLAREFYRRIYNYYTNDAVWVAESRDAYFEKIKKRVFTGKNDELQIQWVFEPKVAQKVFFEMLNETSVTTVFNEQLAEDNGVVKLDLAIKKIKMKSGNVYQGKMFIDASYEGDLMARAGVGYIVGRESQAQYGESYNGILLGDMIGHKGRSIDPYILPGKSTSGLLPFMESAEQLVKGEGDHRLQAYCYRFTLTMDPNNQLPIQKPVYYNPLWYEYLARKMALMTNPVTKDFLTLTPMPNKKTDTNHADFVGANYEWPESDEQKRNEIAVMHKQYTLGLMWFLTNDPRVPEHIREEVKQYGWPKDEFVNTAHFPHQIYVREARRMISSYVMTEHDYFGDSVAMDPIGLGTYWLDSHVVSHVVDKEGKAYIEGAFWEKNSNTYPISFRSVVPQENECSNLLVPVCLSASHAAYGSIRMEPVYMVLGESVGVAASLAIKEKCSIQLISYENLKENLILKNQIIEKP